MTIGGSAGRVDEGTRKVTWMMRAAMGAALVLGTLAGAPVAAQDDSAPATPAPEHHFRVGTGVLMGTAGLGVALDLSLNRGSRLYRTRLTVHDNLAETDSIADRRYRGVTEVALMLGRGRRYSRSYGSVSAGIAMVELIEGIGEESVLPGVPLEAQLIVPGTVRLGATVAANMNLKSPFVAIIFSVQFGGVP